jgi:hypothetical protein
MAPGQMSDGQDDTENALAKETTRHAKPLDDGIDDAEIAPKRKRVALSDLTNEVAMPRVDLAKRVALRDKTNDAPSSPILSTTKRKRDFPVQAHDNGDNGSTSPLASTTKRKSGSLLIGNDRKFNRTIGNERDTVVNSSEADTIGKHSSPNEGLAMMSSLRIDLSPIPSSPGQSSSPSPSDRRHRGNRQRRVSFAPNAQVILLDDAGPIDPWLALDQLPPSPQPVSNRFLAPLKTAIDVPLDELSAMLWP